MSKIKNHGAFIGVGVAVGAALGIAYDNIGLGVALGTAFGAALSIPHGSSPDGDDANGKNPPISPDKDGDRTPE